VAWWQADCQGDAVPGGLAATGCCWPAPWGVVISHGAPRRQPDQEVGHKIGRRTLHPTLSPARTSPRRETSDLAKGQAGDGCGSGARSGNALIGS
jgi:hypothetical protein